METPKQNVEPVDSAELELQKALEMPDAEYITHLEEYIVGLSETNTYGREAIETFVELLEFIGENFGHTLDYPIRVDNDFYEDLFAKKLQNCQEKIEAFLEKYEDDEDLGESEEEVF